MFKRFFANSTFAFRIGISQIAWASDMAREKRIADNIKDCLIIGEVVMLKANSDQFMTLISNEEPKKIRGSVIILHGTGGHPPTHRKQPSSYVANWQNWTG